ncbi:MAG: UMP kinase [Alphaproteobacteria bacterium]|nr:UMP kinase [Alphaproteobacteria bacterium]
MKPLYKRILLKLSGEGLAGAGKSGIDAEIVIRLAREIAEIRNSGVDVCLVIGGGNFFRGAKGIGDFTDRSVADQIGMMATVMNALVLKSALNKTGCAATVYSGLNVPQACELYSFRKAMQSLENKEIVIFAGGTGSPYFTTDTGAVLRAAEMHCDVVMKATQVDGVYDSDPRVNPNAVRFDEISYDEAVAKHLNVMDMTAITMARETKMPIMIFAQAQENALLKAVCNQVKHTIIK